MSIFGLILTVVGLLFMLQIGVPEAAQSGSAAVFGFILFVPGVIFATKRFWYPFWLRKRALR